MAISNIAKQLKYTGPGYVDDKLQPVKNVSDLTAKFTSESELKLGMTVVVLNGGGPNIPVDYWYYFPYNEETETFDTSVPPSWYPKVYQGMGGGGTGEIYWEDGAAAITDPDFEAWKDEGIE